MLDHHNQTSSADNYWTPDLSAVIVGRIGKSSPELGLSSTGQTCPAVLSLNNGDFLVIGADVLDTYKDGVPEDVGIAPHETVVMIPREILMSVADEMA